ncbi:MAG: nucleotidyltransferase family protein [Ramlibacter sp.]|nr:nucleotidyltransferase family protein [Ramlibacter sp.]
MILAAGRGERMRPLTDSCPKPLLKVRGKPLIEWHIEALAASGVKQIVINTAWLEDQIPAALGDGSRWGVELHYSMEGRDHGGALETAGGIAKAGPLLAETFWIVSADIFSPGFVFDGDVKARFERSKELAHLWLVPNPPFHPKGDFGISPDGFGLADSPGPDGTRWTYANLALMRTALFAHIPAGQRVALGPLLFERMRDRRISVEPWRGEWHNLGTPQQLESLSSTSRT